MFTLTKPDPKELQSRLAQAKSDLASAQERAASAQDELEDAYSIGDFAAANTARQSLHKAQGEETIARGILQSAEGRLREAEARANDAERRGQIKKRDKALAEKLKAAKAIDDAMAVVADATSRLSEADRIVYEGQRAGVVSKNAVPGHNFGVARVTSLIENAMAKHGLPGSKRTLTPRSELPTTVELVTSDNRTATLEDRS